MERITNKHLEALITRLNRLTNSPDEAYSTDEQGKHHANIGNYHLSFAYGGVCVHRMVNEGGGCSTPICHGHVSKRELYDMMSAYIKGIEAVRYQEVKLAA